ncbi:PHP domain-containing protein [Rhizobium sp. KAs_5_22]|uniref:PHP domain-containing protein n=1 Tax=Ciceribacter selenitireducens TaxID=448181 RepID=UPI00048AC38C|nr:PHP domain-containing protein [Ciceribacter selenitireducens]PPJ46737.1 PHP domain-containing protein [Rhizobium sp. KAs_5_22]
MKKIDLHIHTKTSSQDKDFLFSEDNLKRYVRDAELDCIAITNHNLFDRAQFEKITSILDIPVLPGIEIDVEKCHILVLADGRDLDGFAGVCNLVEQRWRESGSPLRYEDFKSILGDLRHYIIIPHYLKEPGISPETLEKFEGLIHCGEVSSPKKFMACHKDPEKLVPVFFSDCRISDRLTDLPTKQTYVDCEELTFGTLRQVLKDRDKVSLSSAGGYSHFQIFPDGQKLSTGLNVVLGDRSSGKSYTLQRICEWFGAENTRYIRQFDLVARDDVEDERKFKDFLSSKTSLFSREYLAGLQDAVGHMLEIDLKSDLDSVEKYVSSLLTYARDTSRHDAFSKATIYNEEPFQQKNLTGLETLIQSTKRLVSNVEYRSLIDKHIPLDALRALYVELMISYGTQTEGNLKRDWVNSVVNDIKTKLQRKSSTTSVTNVDLLRVATNKRAVAKFEELVKAARKPKIPLRKKKGSFDIVAQVGPFTGSGELKELSRSQKAFSSAFKKYDRPYEFLQELRNIGSPVEAADFSRYLVKVEYKILNRDGLVASGGERSEFFLLDQIEGANSADILLIDEPESSFDNHFLKSEVNEIIKEMSRKMPVVVVTHNNTVGVSIRPDYLLYTQKRIEDSTIKWRVFSGSPTSKRLVSTDGFEVNTRDILLGNLEAGVKTYEERSSTYENLKD